MKNTLQKIVLNLALSILLMCVLSLASEDDVASSPKDDVVSSPKDDVVSSPTDSKPSTSSAQLSDPMGFFNRQCKDVVSEYGQNVTDIFMKKGLEETPNSICALIGVCKQTPEQTPNPSVGTTSEDTLYSRVVCRGCKMTVSWLQNRVITNNTVALMLDYGKRLCDNLSNQPKQPKQPNVGTSSLSERLDADHTINENVYELSPDDVIDP